MMGSDFDRVRDVVLACSGLPRRERAEYLGALARHDPELASAARKLLAHDSEDIARSLDAPGASPGDAITDDLPKRIGNYEVRERLGAGGMGVVYVGVDPNLGREVAIKVISDRGASASALTRLREEARLLARVNHPHIATVYSLEQADDRVHLTMELVRGRTLAERLRWGPCSVDEALTVARQIASALDAAHREGVVHRDLKPSNVVLSERLGAKVLDFGLATLVERVAADIDPIGDRDDRTGSLGTPGYMSPEQIRGSGVEPRTDVWAFGCVLFECLAAEPLFGGLPRERIRAALDDDPDPSRLPADVPVEIRELIARSVERPVERRPHIGEVRARLDALEESRALDRVRRKLVAAGPDPEQVRAAGLPFTPTRFVGRDREIADLEALARGSRVVSVVGLGGSGKTRVGGEIARRLLAAGERVSFVDLSSTVDGDSVVDVMLDAVRPTRDPGTEPIELLMSALSSPGRSLVLDGCEDVLVAVSMVIARLLEACPSLHILATSREPLGVPGERVYALSSLALPDTDRTEPEHVLEFDSVALFVERARDLAPSFTITGTNAGPVVELCHRLDGLPLALECAAALVPVLSPAEILARVDERLEAIDPADARAGGLAAVLDDAFDRLSERDRQALRRLSVFRGGFTLTAAQHVIAAEDAPRWDVLGNLSTLIRQSLLVREEAPGGEGSRYRLLDTVRRFAAGKLDAAGERPGIVDRHLRHHAEFASSIRIVGPAQAKSLATIHAEIDNVRLILHGAQAHARAVVEARRAGRDASADVERVILATRIAVGMSAYWIRTGRWTEGRRVCEHAKRWLVDVDGHRTEEYVRLGRNLGEIAAAQGDLDRAREHLSDARAAAEALSDPGLVIGVLNNLGTVERNAGHLDAAYRLYADAIEIRRRHPDDWDLSGMLNNRAVVAAMGARYDDAIADFTESLRIKRELGDERGIAHALNGLGLVLTKRGRFDDARPYLEESLAIKRELGDRPGMVTSLLNLGLNALDRFVSLEGSPGVLDDASGWYDDALEVARDVGDRPNEVMIRAGRAWIAFHRGNLDTARREAEASLGLATEVGNARQRSASLVLIACIRLADGDPQAARTTARDALALHPADDVQHPEAMDVLAWCHHADGDAAATATFLAAAERQREVSGSGSSRWRAARNDAAREWGASRLSIDRWNARWQSGRSITDVGRALDVEVPRG